MRTLKDEIVGKVQAEELMKLVKEHRENCKEDCGISLTILLPLCMKLLGRALTEEETRLFI